MTQLKPYKILPGAITKFKEPPHEFLSNFFPCKVRYEGYDWNDSECAYQQSKFMESHIKDDFRHIHAWQAKRLATQYSHHIDQTFFDKRLEIMEKILRAKFKYDPLSSSTNSLGHRLLYTGNKQLVEVVKWYDPYWGVLALNGQGNNHLGEILTKIRADIQKVADCPGLPKTNNKKEPTK